ncbi:MAG: hypothetical protein IPL20_01455 [Saprospiraceae bacterium]|nr:hypothetical protein [Saprospiraceae bacterium]
MSIEIVYDGFELKMGENHIFSDDWIFPLFETDINLVPLEHIQTCFAFCNMPIVMTAGHYADLFNDLKSDLFDNLVYPPKNIFNKIPYSSVLRYNQDRTRLISYPIIQSVFGSNFDIALLLVGNSFNVTPNIQICQDPLINAEVTCIGFPHICSISEKRPLISINDGNIQSLNTENIECVGIQV